VYWALLLSVSILMFLSSAARDLYWPTGCYLNRATPGGVMTSSNIEDGGHLVMNLFPASVLVKLLMWEGLSRLFND